MTPSLDSLSSQITLALMVGNVLLDQIGLPVPAIPTLVLAGAITADHHWWGLEMFLCAVAACVATDAIWYVAGRWYGNGVMKLLCRVSLTPDSCVSETQGRFERWGPNAIVVAKFVPGLAIIAPPLAGAMRMHWPRFLGLSTLAATLWVGIYLGAGALLKPQIDRLLPRLAELVNGADDRRNQRRHWQDLRRRYGIRIWPKMVRRWRYRTPLLNSRAPHTEHFEWRCISPSIWSRTTLRWSSDKIALLSSSANPTSSGLHRSERRLIRATVRGVNVWLPSRH